MGCGSGGFYPDPAIEKNPDMDSTYDKRLDLTSKKKNPDPDLEMHPGSGSKESSFLG